MTSSVRTLAVNTWQAVSAHLPSIRGKQCPHTRRQYVASSVRTLAVNTCIVVLVNVSHAVSSPIRDDLKLIQIPLKNAKPHRFFVKRIETEGKFPNVLC